MWYHMMLGTDIIHKVGFEILLLNTGNVYYEVCYLESIIMWVKFIIIYNSLITNKVMTHQSCKIGSMYKTLFCKSNLGLVILKSLIWME